MYLHEYLNIHRMGTLLKQQNIKKSNISSSKLEDDERMDLLIDTNDQMIEKLVSEWTASKISSKIGSGRNLNFF